MIFVIDFDYTLFDVIRFKSRLFNCLADLAVGEELFRKTYAATTTRSAESYDYDVDCQLALLAKEIDFNISEAKEKILEVVKQSRECLYSDSEKFLKEMKKRKRPMILLTHGNEQFQADKVQATGIGDYFDQVIFTVEPKEKVFSELSIDFRQAVLINDNPTENKELKDKFPELKIIRVRRPGAKFSHWDGDNEIVEFDNLDAVGKYLKLE